MKSTNKKFLNRLLFMRRFLKPEHMTELMRRCLNPRYTAEETQKEYPQPSEEGPLIPPPKTEQLRLPFNDTNFDIYNARKVLDGEGLDQRQPLPYRLALVISESHLPKHVTVEGFRLIHSRRKIEQPHDLTTEEVSKFVTRKSRVIIQGVPYRKVQDNVFVEDGEKYRGLTYSRICI